MRRFITFCITGTAIVLALAILWPVQAEQIAQRVLRGIYTVNSAHLPLIGQKEEEIKIVDPEAIADTIREHSSSALSSLLKGKQYRGQQLTIEDIIDETNKRRIGEGLQPLKSSQLLIESAKIKTDDMIALQYFEHESPSGKSVSDLGTAVGYDYLIMGENLALGDFKDAQDLLQAWMDSPGHRANIVSTLYQEIGIYVARGTYEGREVWFAVQHFGTGRTACPTVSKVLKDDIDAINVNLNRQQQDIEALKEEIEGIDPQASSEYRDVIDVFNGMIETYNKTLLISRQKIDEYNKQVVVFNTCLAKYQQ